jgi:hypothetical protein
MAVTRRLIKGSPLTAQEHDDNVDAFDRYKGVHVDLAALNTAAPTPLNGWWALRADGVVRFYAFEGVWREELLVGDLEIIDDQVVEAPGGILKSINIGKLAGYKAMEFHVAFQKDHAFSCSMNITLRNSGDNSIVTFVSNNTISTSARFAPFTQFHISIDAANLVIRRGGFANNDLSATGVTSTSGAFPITLTDDYFFEVKVNNGATDPVANPVRIYLVQLKLKR